MSTLATRFIGEINTSGSTEIKSRGFRWRGSFGALFLVPAGVATLLSQPVISEGTWFKLVIDLLAWAAFFGGLTFRLWPTLYVGARKTSTLVTEGPYSICRNPLYVGSLLTAVSAGLFLKSLLFVAALVLVTVCYVLATIPAEEKKLREIHGRVYDEYCQRTPRYWPDFSLFHTADEVEVKVKGLGIELRRLRVWIWLPFLGALVTRLRLEPWWPHLFRLL